MNDEIKEDELIKSNRKFFNYLISLRNRDLRKEIENCNWNAILQLIRYCEYEITNLQEENEDLKDRLKVMEHFKNSLLEENERLKFWLNDVIFDDNNNDVELPARYLRKLGYIDFDDEKQVYINKHNNEPFLQKEYKEKVFSLKDDELDDYTKQLEYKFKKAIEYCDNNMEFTPRLIDVKNILGGDE